MSRDDDAEREWKVRAWSVPVALVLAIAFHAWALGHWLQRTFLSMMVHELGHAVTAWWCGFAALPTVWKTIVPETRSLAVTAILAAVLGLIAWRSWRERKTPVAALAAALLGLALVGAFATALSRARELIVFGGDAGAMVLGTLLVMTMFAGPESRLRTNQLRWGLLVIGAAAYVDTFSTWWAARSNPGVIPFGEIEGVGLSDPSQLHQVYRWSTPELVDRYVTVGVACALALAAVWGVSTWRERTRAREGR